MPVTANPQKQQTRRVPAQQRSAVENSRPAKLSTAAFEQHNQQAAMSSSSQGGTPHRPSVGTPHRGVNVIRAVDRLQAHPNANIHHELQKQTQYIPGFLQHEFEALAGAAVAIQQQIEQQRDEAAYMETLMTWQQQQQGGMPVTGPQQEVWVPPQMDPSFAYYAAGSNPTPTASGGYPTPTHFNANAKPFYPRWERQQQQQQQPVKSSARPQQAAAPAAAAGGARKTRVEAPVRQSRETRAASHERAPSPAPVPHIKVVTRVNAKSAQQRQAPIVSLKPHLAAHQQQAAPQQKQQQQAQAKPQQTVNQAKAAPQQQHQQQEQSKIAKGPAKVVDATVAAKTRAVAAAEREHGRRLAMEAKQAQGQVVVGVRTSGIARLAEQTSGVTYGTFAAAAPKGKGGKQQQQQQKGKAAGYVKISPAEYKAMYKAVAREAAAVGKKHMLDAAARALTAGRQKPGKQQQQQQQKGAKKAPVQQQQRLSPAAYRALYKTLAREAARKGAERMAAAMRMSSQELTMRHALNHRRNAITKSTFLEHLRQGPAATSMMMGGAAGSLPIRELYRRLAAEAAEIGAMRSAAWGDARSVMQRGGYAAPTATSRARQRVLSPPSSAMHRRHSSVVVVPPRAAELNGGAHQNHSPYPYVQDTESEHRTLLQAAETTARHQMMGNANTFHIRRPVSQAALAQKARGRAIAERQNERHRMRLAADRNAKEVDQFEARRASREDRARPWRRAGWASDIVRKHHGGTPLSSYIDLRRVGAVPSPVVSPSSPPDANAAARADASSMRAPLNMKPISAVALHRAAAAAAKAAKGMTPLQRRRELQRSRATPKKRAALAAKKEHHHEDPNQLHLHLSERDEHYRAELLKCMHVVSDGRRMHSEGEARLRAQNPRLDPAIARATARTTAAMQGSPPARNKRFSKDAAFDYRGALNALRAGDEPYLRLTRPGPAPNAPHPHTFHFEDGVYWNLTSAAMRQLEEQRIIAAAAAKQDRVDLTLAAKGARADAVAAAKEDDEVLECCEEKFLHEGVEGRQHEWIAHTPLRFKNSARTCRPRSGYRMLQSKH